MSDVSSFASAPLPQDLFVLCDDVTRVGWTQGSRIAFTGFADAAEAAWGAATAAAAIVRRQCGAGSRSVSVDFSNVVFVPAYGETWVDLDGRRVARLILPGGGPPIADTRAAPDFGFEIDLGAYADELAVMSTSHVVYRALKGSRLPWALFAVRQAAPAPRALDLPTMVPAVLRLAARPT